MKKAPFLLLIPVIFACAEPEPLRLNDIQIIGGHNSYKDATRAAIDEIADAARRWGHRPRLQAPSLEGSTGDRYPRLRNRRAARPGKAGDSSDLKGSTYWTPWDCPSYPMIDRANWRLLGSKSCTFLTLTLEATA